MVSSFAPTTTTAIGSRRASHVPSTVLSEDVAAATPSSGRKASNRSVISTTKYPHIYEPASSASAASGVVAAPPSVVQEDKKLAELRHMSLKDLKLQCSRRNIRYCQFEDRHEDFVQAVWEDMQDALDFSVTGLVRPGMVAEVTGEQLDGEMTSDDSLILVDVYATWCGPCRMVIPQLEGAAKQLDTKARVVKLDSDKHAEWAGRYQVQGLPTMLLIKNGRVVDRLEGAHMTDSIMEFVRGHM